MSPTDPIESATTPSNPHISSSITPIRMQNPRDRLNQGYPPLNACLKRTRPTPFRACFHPAFPKFSHLTNENAANQAFPTYRERSSPLMEFGISIRRRLGMEFVDVREVANSLCAPSYSLLPNSHTCHSSSTRVKERLLATSSGLTCAKHSHRSKNVEYLRASGRR